MTRTLKCRSLAYFMVLHDRVLCRKSSRDS